MAQQTWAHQGAIPNRDTAVPAAITTWDKFMELKYAQIRVEDLVGENYLTLFTDFCSKMGESPPVKSSGSPYCVASLAKYVRHLINDMKRKYGNVDVIANGPTFFADSEVTQMLKTLDNNHHLTRAF
jgi:hypothetical protein